MLLNPYNMNKSLNRSPAKGEISDCSEPSETSIMSEHEDGYGVNEYQRRYALKIITITWTRDSHGLFDFENR